MKIILALLLITSPLMAQQTVVIPSTPAQTVVIPGTPAQTVVIPGTPAQTVVIPGTPAQNFTVDTCTYAPSTGVLTINGTPINFLSLGSLTLTAGPTYANGNYLVTITDGAVSYMPYVPVTTTATTGTTYSLAVPAQAGFATNWYQVTGATVKAGQVFTSSPVFTGTPGQSLAFIQTQLFVNSAGALWMRISNPTNATFAGTTFTVTVQ